MQQGKTDDHQQPPIVFDDSNNEDKDVSKPTLSEATNSEDSTVHLENYSSLGLVTVKEDRKEVVVVEEDSQKDETKEQAPPPDSILEKNRRRVISDVSLPSLGSSPPSPKRQQQKPRSVIGSVYRRSHSGEGDRPVIRTITASARDMDKLDPNAVIGEIDDGEATWNDVFRACCCHNKSEWMKIGLFLATLLFLLYFFLVALDLLGTSFKVIGGCTAGSMLGSKTNPMAAVMIGIIATTLLQSSSTTTAIIVSLVSGGLDVNQGIYMVMGANVGTSVTCMLVSLAHMGDGEELEKAFSGSALLFFFNFMTCIILLPLEITTGYLYKFTKLMLPENVQSGEKWEGPIKRIVSPLVKKIIIANKDLIDDISTGEIESCSKSNFYPINCTDGLVSYSTCEAGVIGCEEPADGSDDLGSCPFFFQEGASLKDDMMSGGVCLFIALMLLIFCLIGLVALLRKMLFGASTRVLYKATSINPYLAIIIGGVVTVVVQSSSITSSTLVPLAGIGVLDLESMFPLIVGADIGTTITALLAALVSSKVEALQIALVHLFFNVTGFLLWYPIPLMRRIILKECVLVGKVTRNWRGFPIVFIAIMYVLFPLLVLGISSCFEKRTKGFTALGAFLLLLIFGAITYMAIWWKWRDGREKFQDYITKRQRKAAAIHALADDLDYLKVDTEWCKNEIGRIKDYASHLQTTVRMEEGRPFVTIQQPPSTEGTGTVYTDEDDNLSTFQSCRSKPWKDILYMGAGSIRSEL